MLRLYRNALRIRSALPAFVDSELAWLDAPAGVLAFSRSDEFVNVTNLSAEHVALPPHASVLLSSSPLDDGLLPPDSTAWLRTQQQSQEKPAPLGAR
jgi:alpha-glucosidase